MKKLPTVFLLIFALGALVRFVDVWRPVERASWRECDLASISRNYVREGMNPFFPRIDWRGTSAGYAEMEFPVYPFLTAIFYRLFGFNEYIPRLVNFLFSLAALWFFFRLARSFLDDWAAVFAFAFFAFHPLVVEISTSIQPEGLMLLCYTASVYFFSGWLKNDSNKDFVFAALFTALAILAKAPAAHIGLLFGVLLLQKFGLGAFRQSKVWLFGIFSLLPAALWYLHAKSLWKNYGNSLGVSNETHLVGADFFTNSYFIKGILSAEIFAVWLGFGLILGIFAVWRGRREKVVFLCLLWLASAFAFYVIAARTTADDWAIYYHIFSVAPAALLFGFGAKKFGEFFRSHYNFSSHLDAFARLKQISLILLLAISIAGTFLLEAKRVRANFLQHRVKDESFACAQELKPYLKNEGLILASGGNCFDADRLPVAYNASFMFYWLDRKGFNICTEQQSLEKVREFASKGAKYFVAQKDLLAEKPNLENELRENFPVVAECDAMILFELKSNP
ncbi:MAG TPA: glycosyltransferase family 39 protein [Pyrinomonadaceae bacterium]|jgi:4-amino-4-deoxy-L-arabinose transferase-like glycosyltransferase